MGTGNEDFVSSTLQLRMYAFLMEFNELAMSDALSPKSLEARSGKILHTAEPEPSEKKFDMDEATATCKRFVNRVEAASGVATGVWRLLMLATCSHAYILEHILQLYRMTICWHYANACFNRSNYYCVCTKYQGQRKH